MYFLKQVRNDSLILCMYKVEIAENKVNELNKF